jgi:hypothetical protein
MLAGPALTSDTARYSPPKMKKSPPSGMTFSVELPGAGFELSALTTIRFAAPGLSIAVTSKRKRENAPLCSPARTPLTQTSAMLPTPSNWRYCRRPGAAAGAVKPSRYQPMPCELLVSGERTVPYSPRRFHVCGRSTDCHLLSSNPGPVTPVASPPKRKRQPWARATDSRPSVDTAVAAIEGAPNGAVPANNAATTSCR